MPGLTIRAGELTTRITIQEQASETSDGQGGRSITWGGPGHEWRVSARKKFIAGGDVVEENQRVSRRRYEYKIRRRSDVVFTQAMRVKEGTKTLDISRVSADDSDLSAIYLECLEVPT